MRKSYDSSDIWPGLLLVFFDFICDKLYLTPVDTIKILSITCPVYSFSLEMIIKIYTTYLLLSASPSDYHKNQAGDAIGELVMWMGILNLFIFLPWNFLKTLIYYSRFSFDDIMIKLVNSFHQPIMLIAKVAIYVVIIIVGVAFPFLLKKIFSIIYKLVVFISSFLKKLIAVIGVVISLIVFLPLIIFLIFFCNIKVKDEIEACVEQYNLIIKYIEKTFHSRLFKNLRYFIFLDTYLFNRSGGWYTDRPTIEDIDLKAKLCNAVVFLVMMYESTVWINFRMNRGTWIIICGIWMGLFWTNECLEKHVEMRKRLRKLEAITMKPAKSFYFQETWDEFMEFYEIHAARNRRIETEYKDLWVKNIRWLQLYEHIIINAHSTIHAAIDNYENGVCGVDETIEAIIKKENYISEVSEEYCKILPSSKKQVYERLDLIPLLKQFCDENNISYRRRIIGSKDYDEHWYFFMVKEEIRDIFGYVYKYLLSLNQELAIYYVIEKEKNSLKVTFYTKSSFVFEKKIKRDSENVNSLWDTSKTIDYYDFPLSLAIASALLKEYHGELSIELSKDTVLACMRFSDLKMYYSNPMVEHNNENIVDLNDYIDKCLHKYSDWFGRHEALWNSDTKEIIINGNGNVIERIVMEFFRFSLDFCEEKQKIREYTDCQNEYSRLHLSFWSSQKSGSTLKKIAEHTMNFFQTHYMVEIDYIPISLVNIIYLVDECNADLDINIEEYNNLPLFTLTILFKGV